MKRSSIPALIAVGVFAAVAMWILTKFFYSYMPTVPASVAMTLWLLAAVVGFAAIRVRQRVEEDAVGQDRSQLNPVTAAKLLVVAKASAWTGALFGGAYIGRAFYVLPKAQELVAAGEDAPLVVAAALGGVAVSAAGVWLERACSVPPPPQGETVR
ncbi:DUF3180 domain-containing protein [Corynebacterium pseudopelargi]|uniref:DUF3180 domain-containing protein n=1 Tax=Corynebacterium pseudopelargi TaxID=2080757 RepID=A0A3G6IS77_9CORY|nr:DUF3180 domain-containing protein [Corynebacterium pseudopelargi]AZA08452.1 hypothetical protein CPPEL_01525 [Corynebacterium pseudopelargi]